MKETSSIPYYYCPIKKIEVRSLLKNSLRDK